MRELKLLGERVVRILADDSWADDDHRPVTAGTHGVQHPAALEAAFHETAGAPVSEPAEV